MAIWYLKIAGICINFIGAIFIVVFSIRARGLTTNADIMHFRVHKYQYIGGILLSVGFALQIVGYILELYAP